MTAFDPQTLASDCVQVRRIIADFVAARSSHDWECKTGKRAKDWTLHQTLAHLAASAKDIQEATSDALAGRPIAIVGVSRRDDLPVYNEREIAVRQDSAPQALAENLFATLDRCAEYCRTLTPQQLTLPVSLPVYNRPLTVAEALGWQLAHPGVVHAAQLANGAGVKPLWCHYAPEVMHRQLTRFLHLMSHSYWPERGGDVSASLNFIVAGPGGGRWYITMAPDGGSVGEGAHPHPALSVWTRNTDALCRLLMIQTSIVGAMARGQMLAWGDLRLGLRIPHLFIPT